MRNNNYRSIVREIVFYVEELPYFSIENLKIFPVSPSYLRIILARLETKGEIIRLKKGLYTSAKFIDRVKMNGEFSNFLEFMAGSIYYPSYISLEYVLYENNILTEIPQNFTLVTKNKTAVFSNKLGNFLYHNVKESIFCGFRVERRGDFFIYKAEKSKALFDFLYLRKRILYNKKLIEELRLNLGGFTLDDKKKFKKYIEIDSSKRMKEIYTLLFKK